MMFAIFTEDGIPRWFGPEAVAGAVPVDGVSKETLLTCRLVAGEWLPRPVNLPPLPTPEEIDAQREADFQIRLEAWEAEVDAAIESSQAWRAYRRGEMTLSAYREAAQAIRDSFPLPER
ncbi:MAG: hypothetical protein JNN02_11205 [Tabrizicola sp.]|nr:hypothetical protein [Tabrizicola sp.]